MNELVEFIELIALKIVDRDKLFRFLYEHKVPADRLYFNLITASKSVKEDYLEEFEEEDIYEN